MPSPYSQDLRDRILAAYDRGMRTKQISETFNVSSAWARAVNQRRRETGETTALPMGGARIIKIDASRLTALVAEYPDATLAELRDRLGVQCTEPAICIALKRLGLSYKKKRSMPRSRIAPTSQNDERTGSMTNMLTTRVG
jgi:transposase